MGMLEMQCVVDLHIILAANCTNAFRPYVFKGHPENRCTPVNDHLWRHRLPRLLRWIVLLQRPQRVLSCLCGRLGGPMTAAVRQYARLCHGAVTRVSPNQLTCNAQTMTPWWHRGRVWLVVIVLGSLIGGWLLGCLLSLSFVIVCVGVCVWALGCVQGWLLVARRSLLMTIGCWCRALVAAGGEALRLCRAVVFQCCCGKAALAA